MCDLNKRSSKEGVIYGQDVGSGTNILKRKLKGRRQGGGGERGAGGKTGDGGGWAGGRGGGGGGEGR